MHRLYSPCCLPILLVLLVFVLNAPCRAEMQKTAAVVHFNPLGLDVERLPIDRSVVLTFGAGVGSLLLKMRGDASEPYVSKTAEMPAGAGEAWPRETLSLYDQMAADYGLR